MRLLQTIVCIAAGALGGNLVAPAEARQAGQDVIAEVNRGLVAPGTKDLAEVLFPTLAEIDKPPAQPASLRAASLMTPSSRQWGEWEAWAKAEKQQAALAALKTVADPKAKYLLQLPYGRASVKAEWVQAGLFVDLGDPPLLALAATGSRYLEALDRLALLCTVEAERLATAGQADECLAVLINWLRLARIIADRPFAHEKAWALAQGQAAVERLGDVACTHAGLFGEKQVQDATRELDPRAIALERIRFPTGERQAITQLISLTIEERGWPKPDSFGPVLGRLTVDRTKPFDLFNQAAYWTRIGKEHAGWFDCRDEADKVLGDLRKRWEINNFFDPIMQTPTDYSRMDRLKYAMIAQVVEPVANLYDERILTATAVLGVRSALGAVGYRAVHGVWPPSLPAVQPRFVQSLDYDPWYFEREREVRSIYRYFVPMRDQPVGPRALPKPHTIRVSLERTAGMKAEADASAVLSRRFFWGLGDVASLPGDALDPATGVVNAERLREVLLGRVRTEPITDDERRTLRSVAEALISLGADSVEKIEQETAAMFGHSMLREWVTDDLLASIGLSFEEFKTLTIRLAVEQFKTDAHKAIIAAVRARRDPTDDEILALREARATILCMPEFIDPYLTKILVKQSMASAAEDAFTIELMDSDFVLYSVGSDGKADFARSVGRAGPDILIWPPVLTLERRARGGN